ncbi:hypothetical protein [Halorubrum laminariae]
MGSATAYHLADQNLDVLASNATTSPIHGGHRMELPVRRAYYKHPSYVPLIERAYELWDELANETGRGIIHRTGSIDAGPAEDPVFAGSKRSCEEQPFHTRC